MTKQELELMVQELQKIIIEKDEELNRICQNYQHMKELNKMAERRLELSQEREEALQKQIEELEKPKHNARNAGRKKADDKWVESFSRFGELYEYPKTINEIMEEMKISRATYYRYKKLYEDIQN